MYNPNGLRSIYVCNSSQRYGLAVGAGEKTAFREFPKCVELWQDDGKEEKKIRRFHKKHILFVEYDDNPFIWVSPKPSFKSGKLS